MNTLTGIIAVPCHLSSSTKHFIQPATNHDHEALATSSALLHGMAGVPIQPLVKELILHVLDAGDTANQTWGSPSPDPFSGLASFGAPPMQNGPAMFPPLTCTSSEQSLNMLELAGDLCQPAFRSIVGQELFPELRLPG